MFEDQPGSTSILREQDDLSESLPYEMSEGSRINLSHYFEISGDEDYSPMTSVQKAQVIEECYDIRRELFLEPEQYSLEVKMEALRLLYNVSSIDKGSRKFIEENVDTYIKVSRELYGVDTRVDDEHLVHDVIDDESTLLENIITLDKHGYLDDLTTIMGHGILMDLASMHGISSNSKMLPAIEDQINSLRESGVIQKLDEESYINNLILVSYLKNNSPVIYIESLNETSIFEEDVEIVVGQIKNLTYEQKFEAVKTMVQLAEGAFRSHLPAVGKLRMKDIQDLCLKTSWPEKSVKVFLNTIFRDQEGLADFKLVKDICRKYPHLYNFINLLDRDIESIKDPTERERWRCFKEVRVRSIRSYIVESDIDDIFLGGFPKPELLEQLYFDSPNFTFTAELLAKLDDEYFENISPQDAAVWSLMQKMIHIGSQAYMSPSFSSPEMLVLLGQSSMELFSSYDKVKGFLDDCLDERSLMFALVEKYKEYPEIVNQFLNSFQIQHSSDSDDYTRGGGFRRSRSYERRENKEEHWEAVLEKNLIERGFMESEVRRAMLFRRELQNIVNHRFETGKADSVISDAEYLDIMRQIGTLDGTADEFSIYHRGFGRSRIIPDLATIWGQRVLSYYDSQLVGDVNLEELRIDTMRIYAEGFNIYRLVSREIVPGMDIMNDFLQSDVLRRGVWFSGRDGIPLLMAVKAEWFGAEFGRRSQYEDVILTQLSNNPERRQMLIGLAITDREKNGKKANVSDKKLTREGLRLYMEQEARFYDFVKIALVSRLVRNNYREDDDLDNLQKYIDKLGITQDMVSVDTGYSGSVIRWLQKRLYGNEFPENIALLSASESSKNLGVRQILPEKFTKLAGRVESLPKPFERALLIDSDGEPLMLPGSPDLAALSWVVDHAMIRCLAPRFPVSPNIDRVMTDIVLDLDYEYGSISNRDEVAGEIFDNYQIAKEYAAPAFIKYVDSELAKLAKDKTTHAIVFPGDESFLFYVTAVDLLDRFPERYRGVGPRQLIYLDTSSLDEELAPQLSERGFKLSVDNPINIHLMDMQANPFVLASIRQWGQEGIFVSSWSSLLGSESAWSENARDKVTTDSVHAIVNSFSDPGEEHSECLDKLRVKASMRGVKDKVNSFVSQADLDQLQVEPDWHIFYGF